MVPRRFHQANHHGPGFARYSYGMATPGFAAHRHHDRALPPTPSRRLTPHTYRRRAYSNDKDDSGSDDDDEEDDAEDDGSDDCTSCSGTDGQSNNGPATSGNIRCPQDSAYIDTPSTPLNEDNREPALTPWGNKCTTKQKSFVI